MRDTIYREDAIKALDVSIYKDDIEDAINAIPSADRPQGEWIDKGDHAECSNCGANSGTQFDGVEPVPRKTNFCPNCGARMKGANKMTAEECNKFFDTLKILVISMLE